MRPNATNTTVPPIPTPATRQLRRVIDAMRRHKPELDYHILAIRAGDNERLMEYVRRIQAGDDEAAHVAVWAISYRMCAVIRDRLPRAVWRSATDELLALVFLAMVDVGQDESTRFLSDKIISRARRRYERALGAQRATADREVTTEIVSVAAEDVEDRALARLDLAALGRAIEAGAVSRQAWATIVSARFGDR